jgi:hypothetical protein
LTRRTRLRLSDLHGAARLATHATTRLTDLVEAVHERVVRIPGLSSTPDGRTDGITGFVYKSIRGVTRAAGGSVDAVLGWIALAQQAEPHPSAGRDALVAALNGVVGDHLSATANPLATSMSFCRDGRTLALDAPSLASSLPDAGPRVLVLLHGLCMSDQQWSRDGHDHGAALARDLGFTPVYLRYNSGLHVSTNGRALAQQMELLIRHWPVSVRRLAVLGHSMGGLLARSALHYGAQAGHDWVNRVDDLVTLGTPHHGAALERAGHWVDIVLGSTPYAAPFARLGKGRSAGITDLRFGNLLDEDWTSRDRFARGPDDPQHLPLPEHVRCHAAAASLAARSSGPKQRLVGDGLVSLDSALGRHRDPARTLRFGQARQWVGHGMGHLDLLNRAEVYAQLLRWLTQPAGRFHERTGSARGTASTAIGRRGERRRDAAAPHAARGAC